jgi:pilus assembly protein CpaC
MRSGRRAAKVIALVASIIVILVATPQAQQYSAYSGTPGAVTAGMPPAVSNTTTVDLLVGRSTILNVGAPIARVSLTVPDIADAMVTTPQQVLVHGKTPGTISLFVWDRAGGITTYEVNVRRDLSQLIDQMKQLFPGEPIVVTGSGKDVVISGTVSSKYVMDKAADVASGYVEKKENVVNLLKQQEGVASNQVLLRVRFAEVSRSAMQELGVNLIANGVNNQWFGRTTTQQFAAPNFDQSVPGGLTFSDFLNIFLFNSKHDIGAVIRALSSKGMFESLAEPNLIASNGKEASFLAGGEYPYPIVQPGSAGNAITITFKEFGVRLNFTPTVLAGDLISLHVKPEVSTLDFTNAIILEGFRVPALTTRRTETEVELQDGQTFAIAGLMNNTVNNTMQKIPGIGDVPILGNLFKSRAYQKDQTELVVMITPQIIRRGSTGVSESLPSLIEPYMTPPTKTYAPPAPYTGSPRYPVNQAPNKKNSGTDDPQAPQQPAPSTTPSQDVRQQVQQVQQQVQQAEHAPSQSSAAQPTAPGAVTVPPSALLVDPGVPAKPLAQDRVPNPVPVQPVASGSVPQTQGQAQQTTDAVRAAQQTPANADAPAPKPDPKAVKAQQAADRKAAQEQQAAAKKAAAAQAAADKEAAKEKAAADKKAAEDKAAADKKAAEDKAAADKKAAELKAQQDKLDQERAKREAEVAKKNAEDEQKRQEDQKKQDKAIADAAARLKAAQAAYQAELDKKAKGGQL